MLPVSASKMNRKAIALGIVLLLAGLAPATAMIGICTRMPCCSHAPSDAVAFSTESSDCCTSITCYESPSVKLANRVASADVVFAPELLAAASTIAAPTLTIEVIDTSPPATARQRLAALSVLRI